jgi:hypothetical protein
MEKIAPPGYFKKILNYLVVKFILHPMDFYWCDKCERFTRYDYQITIQPTVDGKKAKMRVPYCTRCLALDISKRKNRIRTLPKKKIKIIRPGRN